MGMPETSGAGRAMILRQSTEETRMRQKLLAVTAIVALLLAGLMIHSSAVAAVPDAPALCDRGCLANLVDNYVAALVRHDSTGLPLAGHVKFTENTATLPLGDGLWVGASEAPANFKIYGLDPVAGQAGIFCVMKEFNKAVIVSIRLRVEGGKITEIEHIVRRDLRPSGLPNLVTARREFLERVPPAERTPREKMRQIADAYFDTIVKGNGSLAPFADDCERHENGVQTTTNKTLPEKGPDGGPLSPAMAKLLALGCEASMNTGGWTYITGIEPRRPLIVDEGKGLVFAYPMFIHRGNVRSMKIVGVPGVDALPISFGPINMEATAVFKIRGGKIHEIEAMGFLLPYNAKTGWE
jgi:hypothetical protein